MLLSDYRASSPRGDALGPLNSSVVPRQSRTYVYLAHLMKCREEMIGVWGILLIPIWEGIRETKYATELR